MAFDGIITKSIIEELNNCILNGKINKVFQPNNNEIILGIYSGGNNYALDTVISSSNYRICLTTNTKPNPINAPGFCMLLRKHIVGSKIRKIYSPGLERIITFELECYNELNDLTIKKLIVELMGKHSNVILTNSNDVIIDSLRHLDSFSNSNRDILPSHKYELPQSDKLDFLSLKDFDEFYKIAKDFTDIETDIPNRFTGISKAFIHYGFSKLEITNDINKENLKKIFNYIFEIIKNIGTSENSCVFIDKKDYTICPIHNEDNLHFNFFIDDFYSEKEGIDSFTEYRNSILRLVLSTLKKITKKLNNINSKLEECKDMDTYKLYGELITANLYKIKDTSGSSIKLENYYDNNNIIDIPLDKKYNVNINAKNYFKKYNKLKNALKIVEAQKKETIQELNYIESIIYELESARTISEVNEIYTEISESTLFSSIKRANHKTIIGLSNKKFANSGEPIITTIDDFTVYIGRNNKQNDYLTMKFAKRDDLWFHTKDIHGSHVILQTNKKEPTIEVIIRCAELAAYYSKAKNSSSVPVDYTIVKNVKKPSGAKPGMVIYTHNQTINVNPKK